MEPTLPLNLSYDPGGLRKEIGANRRIQVAFVGGIREFKRCLELNTP